MADKLINDLILTEDEAAAALRLTPGTCPFCDTVPAVEWLPNEREVAWRATGCEHLVSTGGTGCEPDEILAQPRSWQGPGWPWQRGWPVEWGIAGG